MEKTDITSRAGNFTSSNIHKLMSNGRIGGSMGQPGYTYIEEKKMELKLGRQLQQEVFSRAISWGKFVQHRVTNTLLDTGCKPTKDIRRAHKTISNWTGAEDYIRTKHIEYGELNQDVAATLIVGEVKCFELKNFCKVHEAASFGYQALKEECPEVFWQLVSNSILNDTSKAELCLYVPYKKELKAIKDEARETGRDDLRWLAYNTEDDALPYLIEGGHYKNLTTFQFDILESDKQILTDRVQIAIKLLK